jgi:hypothetical protein
MPQKKEEKDVTLKFHSTHLYEEWTYKVDGEEYVIEKGGTPVPADKADELIKASRKTEAKLRKA